MSGLSPVQNLSVLLTIMAVNAAAVHPDSLAQTPKSPYAGKSGFPCGTSTLDKTIYDLQVYQSVLQRRNRGFRERVEERRADLLDAKASGNHTRERIAQYYYDYENNLLEADNRIYSVARKQIDCLSNHSHFKTVNKEYLKHSKNKHQHQSGQPNFSNRHLGKAEHFKHNFR